ncbi:MAG: hypothetical protein V3V74_07375 [Nitrosomonadaceae bacterium]
MSSNVDITNISKIELTHYILDNRNVLALYLFDIKGFLKSTVTIHSPDESHLVMEKFDPARGPDLVDAIVNDFKGKATSKEENEPKGYTDFKSAGDDVYAAINILRDHFIKEAIDLLWQVKSGLDNSKSTKSIVSDERWKHYFEQVIGYELNDQDVKNMLSFLTRSQKVQEIIREDYEDRPAFYSRSETPKNKET